MKMKRVYRPVHEWEEMAHNMWGNVPDRKEAVIRAIEFTGDHALYGEYMQRVISEWPISCENALTDYQMNRKAWLGHAAVALALELPEDIVREAWSKLSDEQQILANAQAARAIESWEFNYIQGLGLLGDVGEQMLFEWDTGRSAHAVSQNTASA